MLDANNYLNKMLAERYHIVREIGHGASSLVFYAEDMMTKQEDGTPMPVALKILDKDSNEYKLNSRSFQTETQAVVDMPTNPHIVAVQDVSYDCDTDVHFIVMEYVKGTTLRRYMSSHGTFSSREIVSIALQVLFALQNAHEVGVVHRDVKPQNILVQNAEETGSGIKLPGGKGMPYIKLADFGIALLPDEDLFAMTDRGVGTVHYISPEQAGGRTIDARSDIYSLGVVMYEMATGRVPFDAESATAVITKHQTHAPMHARMFNPNVPLSLDHIIFTAMQKDPHHRFKDAAAMEKKLYEVLRELDGGARAIPEISTLPRKEISMPTRIPKAAKMPKEPKPPKEPKVPKEPKAPKAPKEPKAPRVKKERKPIPKGVWIGGGASLLAAALIVAGIFLFPILFSSNDAGTVQVPNLIDTLYSESNVYQDGITVVVDGYEHHPTVKEGYVISQSEGAGKEVAAGVVIHITVSKGPVMIAFDLPKEQGLSFHGAKDYLEEKYTKLTVSPRYEKAEYDPALGARGAVIGAYYLADGEEIALTGGSIPDDYVSIVLKINGDRLIDFSIPEEHRKSYLDALNYINAQYRGDIDVTQPRNEIASEAYPNAMVNGVYVAELSDGTKVSLDGASLIANTPIEITLICNKPPVE